MSEKKTTGSLWRLALLIAMFLPGAFFEELAAANVLQVG